MKQSHFQILHMEGFEEGEITVWSYAHFFFFLGIHVDPTVQEEAHWSSLIELTLHM